MTKIGTVGELWRYPVKSMGGERLEATAVGPKGLAGDRGWAVRDEVRGGIRGAKKLPGLMTFRARYPEPPSVEQAGVAEITTPEGEAFAADHPEASQRISAALGHEVTIWPLLPADRLDHYRRVTDDPDLEREMRSIFGRESGEPLPDLSVFPPELFEYESLPGTYFDALPLLLMTRQSLDTLAELAPGSAWDVRRFRPNVLIETGAGAGRFPELEWIGRRVRIGEVTLRVELACPRCVMTTHGFDELPKDPAVLRTIVREADQNVGVYAAVEGPGVVRAGDVLELL